MVSIHARLATGDARFRECPLPPPCFNSRPSCDGRPGQADGQQAGRRFNSRPSCDGRPKVQTNAAEYRLFQFTPVLRRATDETELNDLLWFVSIHARLATGDARPTVLARCMKVSIHARLATGDARRTCRGCSCSSSFNSRPSCDGRPPTGQTNATPACFNSRPSCDGRRAAGRRRTV